MRLGIIEGEFHWHSHEVEDEFFLCLEGQLLIDIEDADTVTLDPHQGYTVPRGVVRLTSMVSAIDCWERVAPPARASSAA